MFAQERRRGDRWQLMLNLVLLLSVVKAASSKA